MKRLFVAAAVSAVYLFFYIPIAVLIAFSFNSATFPSPWTSFTCAWYYELFNTPYVWYAFLNSFIIAICAMAMSIILSLGLVYFRMFRRKSSHLESTFSLFYLNLIVPEVVLGVGLLTFFVVCGVPLGIITLIVAHTVLGLGFAVPLIHGRFNELDIRLVEASLDLGASIHQTFFSIIIPLLRSTIIASALLIFIISFDDFVLSYFCAGTSVQTLSLYLLSMLRTGISPMMNALSTLLFILSSLLVLLFCRTSFVDNSQGTV
ncbi:MAG: ABC transporter permease [Candidatus Babeliaceae bacterium]|nr:ABC transporter permease [Candidatus Babeliaceae bacterium]